MSLTIRTNIPSIIAQGSLAKSTNALNTAIERMTTGLKINSAKDNAAGYSIVNDMTTKLSSWEVAENNTKTGIDLVTTAGDSLELINSHLQRIRDLCEQGANGTYGESSKEAIQSEIDARVAEINRVMNSTEFNGIKLFTGGSSEETTNSSSSSSSTPPSTSSSATPPLTSAPLMATAPVTAQTSTGVTAGKGPNGKFIDDIVEETPDVIVTDPTQLASAISGNTKIGIGNAETLAKLAELVNSGTDCEGKTIILTSDIDLSGYHTGTGWTPIGTDSNSFLGTFNGNGHMVSNLYINNPTANYQGLFEIIRENGEVKNVGIENCDVTGSTVVGSLMGLSMDGIITNCYSTGKVSGSGCVGGLAGMTLNNIASCYATVDVSGGTAAGNLSGTGGLVGVLEGTITNSYATGDVSGGYYAGGLVGMLAGTITNSYATGDVEGDMCAGGLFGYSNDAGTITNSSATGDVEGDMLAGGLGGYAGGEVTITNSYAKGDVGGDMLAGGLMGFVSVYNGSGESFEVPITDSASYSESVTGNGVVASFIGGIGNTKDEITYGIVTMSNNKTIELDGLEKIGGVYTHDFVPITYDKTEWENNIEYVDPPVPPGPTPPGPTPEPTKTGITLQVGIYADDSSQISFETSIDLGELTFDVSTEESARQGLTDVDTKMAIISAKQTELGAIQNRLESAIDSIETNYENLVSSRSTLRDTDVAKESSEYIKQQILQQASATLLSTANQSPSIALQLI